MKRGIVMKRKRKGWLLIVTLLVVSMLLSGCGESVPAEGELNVQASNTQVVQEEAKQSRFMLIEEGKIEGSSYKIFVDTTTRVLWIRTMHTYMDGTGNGIGLAFEPLIDSEGKPLLYEGELTAQK